MRRIFRTLAALLALAATGLGMQACNDEEKGILLALGFLDAPTKEAAIGYAQDACTENCDGEVDDLTVSIKGPPPPEGDYDDDYDALVEFLGALMLFDNEQNAEDAFVEYIENFYGENLPEDAFDVGPLAAGVDLGAACAPGTGGVVITREVTVTAAPMEAGLVDGRGTDYEEWSATMRLSGCTVTGDFFGDAGEETVSLSGTLTYAETDDDDEEIETYELTGSITVNRGLAAVAGDAPTPVWGLDETVTFDVFASDELGDIPPDDGGGVCYGGDDASSEDDCDGIFMEAGAAFGNVWSGWD